MRRCAPHSRRLVSAVALPIAITMLACGNDEPAEVAIPSAGADRENRAPVIGRLSVDPASPMPGAAVRAVVDASDPDADPVKMSYEWFLDGEPVGNGTAKLMLEGATRGAELRVTVVASDGRDDSEPASLRVRLANRPPTVQRLDLAPALALTAGERIEVAPVSSDPEGDELEHSYLWTVNGEPAVGASGDPFFDTSGLVKGDVVRVEVRAHDRDDESEPFVSPPIRVENRPPRVASKPERASAGGPFRYTVRADDPDGDAPLRFELEDAPDGMRIDAASGEIVWRPRPDQAGRHRVRVVVDDLNGGRIAHAFDVDVGGTVSPASAAR